MEEMTTDMVKELKENLKIICDEQVATEDRVAALERIEDDSENIDFAKDLYLIGGYKQLQPFISNKTNKSIQIATCNVFKACLQNNPDCQQYALDIGLMNDAFQLMNTTDEEVLLAGLSLLSSFVRSYDNTRIEFLRLGGFTILTSLIQTNTEIIVKKCLVFLLQLLFDEPNCIDTFISSNSVQYLIPLVQHQNIDIKENSFRILVTCIRKQNSVLDGLKNDKSYDNIVKIMAEHIGKYKPEDADLIEELKKDFDYFCGKTA